MASATDLQDIERRLIVEGSNTKPTRNSLLEYFADYQARDIEDYHVEQVTRKIRAVVVFRKSSSINSVMSSRPHRIDDGEVRVYRSIPDQEFNRRKQGVETLIVSGIKNSSLNQSDIATYFKQFGEIDSTDMNSEDNSCSIKFKDYDSVDQALLDAPHAIRKISVDVRKGDRTNAATHSMKFVLRKGASCTNISDSAKTTNARPIPTVPQTASAPCVQPIYCVYIENLPVNATAEDLAEIFKCSIYNLVISISLGNKSDRKECWVRDINNLHDAKDFVQCYNGRKISGLQIHCEVKEEKQDYCVHFRLGQCVRRDDECYSKHIKCSANGKCPADCPFGHEKGVKASLPKEDLPETYQLKIFGLPKDLNKRDLARKMGANEYNVYIYPKSQMGHVRKLKTFNLARDLMRKWHNRDMGDGYVVKCQIEVVKKSSLSEKPTQESSTFSDDEKDEPRVVDDREMNYEGRLFSQCYDSLLKQKESDDQRRTKLADNSFAPTPVSKIRSLMDLSPNDERTDKQRSEDGRHMSELRKRVDHDSLAYLVEYDTDEEKYRRELKALKMLQDVKGVVQLIELENQSDNMRKQHSNKYQYHIVTERPSGDVLRDFVTQNHRTSLTVLEAIQLVQNLLSIVQRVHSHGVLHQNLEPETIIIKWDSKRTSMDEVQLVLINFSQAHLISEGDHREIKSTGKRWYQPPQMNESAHKSSSTIDASSICAILFWLLTSVEPRYNLGNLPHEQQEAENKINRKIAEAVRVSNSNRKLTSTELQLKTYLIDTFNTAFGYPRYQPWTTSALGCRLESIRELLLPRNPKLDSIETAFQELLSASSSTLSPVSVIPDLQHDLFQRASDAFRQAKTSFSKSSQSQFSWSDGNCSWLDSIRSSANERRHDDILTYFSRNRFNSSSYSLIITCFATFNDHQKIMTLSIGSSINGKAFRVPIGRYPENKNYAKECEDSFKVELKNLIISICKEWHET